MLRQAIEQHGLFPPEIESFFATVMENADVLDETDSLEMKSLLWSSLYNCGRSIYVIIDMVDEIPLDSLEILRKAQDSADLKIMTISWYVGSLQQNLNCPTIDMSSRPLTEAIRHYVHTGSEGDSRLERLFVSDNDPLEELEKGVLRICSGT